MDDRRRLESSTVVSGGQGCAAVKGFVVVVWSCEKEVGHVLRERSNDNGDDLGSWVLVGDGSGGDWHRQRRLSLSVGCATAAPTAGVVMACVNEEEKVAMVEGINFS
ncbi:hypothetical protein DEO72_LG10g1813 [Vigna unguiculata]|uniref:Uncharacterized protein n=1 Tax=Vigna unguiculata TaxID=3917 RepID=A0A4D6N9S2_VIGUN|nr:hypothetical protein DEO72_LG10g1813 [Vigna unguiculata]